MADLDFASIPAPGHTCVVCGRNLAQVGKHPSMLKVLDENQARRTDVCSECWEKSGATDFDSFWLAQREAPKPDPKVTREELNRRLVGLFEKLRTVADPRFRPHLYVLAHTLMKRRLLKWEGAERGNDGVPRILFRDLTTDDVIKIDEIDVNDDRLVAVMREIDLALAGGEIFARDPLDVADSGTGTAIPGGRGDDDPVGETEGSE